MCWKSLIIGLDVYDLQHLEVVLMRRGMVSQHHLPDLAWGIRQHLGSLGWCSSRRCSDAWWPRGAGLGSGLKNRGAAWPSTPHECVSCWQTPRVVGIFCWICQFWCLRPMGCFVLGCELWPSFIPFGKQKVKLIWNDQLSNRTGETDLECFLYLFFGTLYLYFEIVDFIPTVGSFKKKKKNSAGGPYAMLWIDTW